MVENSTLFCRRNQNLLDVFADVLNLKLKYLNSDKTPLCLGELLVLINVMIQMFVILNNAFNNPFWGVVGQTILPECVYIPLYTSTMCLILCVHGLVRKIPFIHRVRSWCSLSLQDSSHICNICSKQPENTVYKKGCYVELSNTTIYWPRSCRDFCITVLILQYAGENEKISHLMF